MLVRPSPHTVTSSAETLADAVAEVFGNEAAMPHIETTGSVACAPALAPAVVAGGLAIGDAILSLDPIRGDGVGFAARGALLAQAVIAAEAGPGALRHYSARLATVFVQHAETTISHYRSSFNAPLWAGEIAAMEAARAQAAACIRGHTFSFWLDGKDLHPGAGVSWNDPAGR